MLRGRMIDNDGIAAFECRSEGKRIYEPLPAIEGVRKSMVDGRRSLDLLADAYRLCGWQRQILGARQTIWSGLPHLASDWILHSGQTQLAILQRASLL